jgi:hypothetical protein
MDYPTLCLDFDGVLHAYTSGWQGAAKVTDGPVPGAMQFLIDATAEFRVAVYSTRSETYEGRTAMQTALRYWLCEAGADWTVFDQLQFPVAKPLAMVTIDDRAITFTGTFPPVSELLMFQPWTKRPVARSQREIHEFLATIDYHDLVQELARRDVASMLEHPPAPLLKGGK